MATFEINGSIYEGYVRLQNGNNSFSFGAEWAGSSSIPWDTTGTVSLRDVSVGDEIVLTRFSLTGGFDGTTYTRAAYGTFVQWDDDYLDEEWRLGLRPQTSADYLTIDGEDDTFLHDTTLYYAGNGEYTLTPPGDYAEYFSFDGYSDGDTITLGLNEPVTANIVWGPSGTTPYDASLGFSQTAYNIFPYQNGNSVTFTANDYGESTVTAIASLPAGATYTTSLKFVVSAGDSTDFAITGYAPNSTISTKLESGAITLPVTFTPENSVPVGFTVASSNASIATVAYSDGTITLTPVAAGTATLTATLASDGGGTAAQHTYTIEIRPPLPNKALGKNSIAFLKEKMAAMGGVTKLTEDDYDAIDSSNNPCLCIANLEPGMYQVDSESGSIYATQYSYPVEIRWKIGGYIFVSQWVNLWNPSQIDKCAYVLCPDSDLDVYKFYNYNNQGWQLENSDRLSMQGYVENRITQYVGDLYQQPTSSTYGGTGVVYKYVRNIIDPETGNYLGETGELWVCLGYDEDPETGEHTYNWEKIAPTNQS